MYFSAIVSFLGFSVDPARHRRSMSVRLRGRHGDLDGVLLAWLRSGRCGGANSNSRRALIVTVATPGADPGLPRRSVDRVSTTAIRARARCRPERCAAPTYRGASSCWGGDVIALERRARPEARQASNARPLAVRLATESSGLGFETRTFTGFGATARTISAMNFGSRTPGANKQSALASANATRRSTATRLGSSA
jgi:hypothetical protein